MYIGRPSLIIMLAWPSVKLLLLNAASCIVSLSRHGPAARPGPGHAGEARVVLLERVADACRSRAPKSLAIMNSWFAAANWM